MTKKLEKSEAVMENEISELSKENETDKSIMKNEVENSTEKKDKTFTVKVLNNPDYCGIGAGGVQFAHGEAVILSERMAGWFKEHAGYKVTEN